ncbi:methylated-DNA--[protein]-cysteine S-methyltransferase [Helicobacter sp. MIT 14-3879]|uniref:methylated-DNA--[protein]-cysteine S-methyltransferase n=1 Tax=Helicobacter sp. MIT 14-3879 TaxID=2040649 RepID=UPI000E1ED7D3|nr:methylated-DNA--[protein]-cysteine S-methyltransferase [Helicobacter sp. MIT 14-3879]RDU59887.1 6-O-methylguanine DNA methyltransferase [Helicobacter sp. MIT 14-3879]
MYFDTYECPFSRIIMLSNAKNLIGLYFQTQQHFEKLQTQSQQKDLEIFRQTKAWLDSYFSGKSPSFSPSLELDSTSFRLRVWQILQKIPKGQTTTYKQIAKIIAQERGIAKMSAQAVGGAVGANPISIIIPCHRVIGTNQSLVGYAGGMDIKMKLLELEGIDISLLKAH